MLDRRLIGVLCVLAAALALPAAANAAPPQNDDLANAIELTGRFPSATGTNVEATKQNDEIDHAGLAGGVSIWYSWKAPADGKATVTTCGSTFDTLLAVYTGAQFPLEPVASNNDDPDCGNRSKLFFVAAAGTTYRIAVDGRAGATGEVWLSLNLAPRNDDFADALPLDDDTGTTVGTTLGAGDEDGEPYHFDSGGSSVWFTWTAPSSGWASFETCGSGFDTVLAVYTGAAVDQLTAVTGNDDYCGRASRAYFRADAGTVYRIALAGYEGETGDFTVSWNRNPPPPLIVGAPTITGTPRDGDTLTASDGQWGGDPPFTYAYVWGRCDRDLENCDYIAEANAKTFAIRSVDVGFRLFVRVTASNAYGSTASFSHVTDLVAARPPSNTRPPVVTGDAKPRGMLVAGGGIWSGTAPLSLAYQWQSCNAAGLNCVDLVGQTGQVMSVTTDAIGSRIRVVVTATNTVGSASAPSEATRVVRVAATRRCVVPRLQGKSLRSARAAITRGHCRVGRVRMGFSARVKAGRVVSQTPRAGRRLAVGARVNLLVSKGKRR